MSPAASRCAWPGLGSPSLLLPVLSRLASGCLWKPWRDSLGCCAHSPSLGELWLMQAPGSPAARPGRQGLYHFALAARLPQLDAGSRLLPR